MIDGDSFKAHDLALDQTVTVRQAMPTSPRDVDAWRQKVQQLVLVRNPNFLNVLDVVFDKSSGFVITEHPRGQSIAELLRERSRFDLEDVLRLMTPLAGALDFAAALACYPNPISACWLFTETRRSCAVDSERRSVSEWPPFLVRLDIWALVRPRKNIPWPFLTWKARRVDQKGLAVRQAARLTYELLSGEQIKESGVRRWYKPVNELNDAANGILYDALQGSPLFENSGCFFHRLESANRSGDGNSIALRAPASPIREYSKALPGTDDVIRRFNRDTQRLATQALVAAAFAILVFGFLIRAEENAWLNANPPTLSKVDDLNGKSSTGETTSEQARGIDHALAIISPPHETLSPWMETPDSTQTPVPALPSEIDRPNAQGNAGSWTAAHRQDSGRVMGLKVHRARSRSSVRLRFVDVKMRLIALWHQSLAQSKKSRTWAAFSNSNKGERSKVSYTAETYH
jgi:hypothetical protein